MALSLMGLVWFGFLILLLLLQVGDVAFSVPNSLVVTLERVLGNETIGKVQFFCNESICSSSSCFQSWILTDCWS